MFSDDSEALTPSERAMLVRASDIVEGNDKAWSRSVERHAELQAIMDLLRRLAHPEIAFIRQRAPFVASMHETDVKRPTFDIHEQIDIYKALTQSVNDSDDADELQRTAIRAIWANGYSAALRGQTERTLHLTKTETQPNESARQAVAQLRSEAEDTTSTDLEVLIAGALANLRAELHVNQSREPLCIELARVAIATIVRQTSSEEMQPCVHNAPDGVCFHSACPLPDEIPAILADTQIHETRTDEHPAKTPASPSKSITGISRRYEFHHFDSQSGAGFEDSCRHCPFGPHNPVHCFYCKNTNTDSNGDPCTRCWTIEDIRAEAAATTPTRPDTSITGTTSTP